MRHECDRGGWGVRAPDLLAVVGHTDSVGGRGATAKGAGVTASYRQHSNAASALVDHDQGSGGQVGLMLIESGNDRAFQMVR